MQNEKLKHLLLILTVGYTRLYTVLEYGYIIAVKMCDMDDIKIVVLRTFYQF